MAVVMDARARLWTPPPSPPSQEQHKLTGVVIVHPVHRSARMRMRTRERGPDQGEGMHPYVGRVRGKMDERGERGPVDDRSLGRSARGSRVTGPASQLRCEKDRPDHGRGRPRNGQDPTGAPHQRRVGSEQARAKKPEACKSGQLVPWHKWYVRAFSIQDRVPCVRHGRAGSGRRTIPSGIPRLLAVRTGPPVAREGESAASDAFQRRPQSGPSDGGAFGKGDVCI